MKTTKTQVAVMERGARWEVTASSSPRTCRVALSQALPLAGRPLAYAVVTKPSKPTGRARGQGESTGWGVRRWGVPAGLSLSGPPLFQL